MKLCLLDNHLLCVLCSSIVGSVVLGLFGVQYCRSMIYRCSPCVGVAKGCITLCLLGRVGVPQGCAVSRGCYCCQVVIFLTTAASILAYSAARMVVRHYIAKSCVLCNLFIVSVLLNYLCFRGVQLIAFGVSVHSFRVVMSCLFVVQSMSMALSSL